MKKGREELLQILIEKLTNVVKGMHRGHASLFGEFKLSRPHIMILFFIAKKKEGVSAKDLATFLNVTPGAITQFIDILEKEKFVQRKVGAKDRRTLQIKLTPSTHKRLALFKKNYHKAVSPAFNDLTEEEIQQFIVLLGKIKVSSELL